MKSITKHQFDQIVDLLHSIYKDAENAHRPDGRMLVNASLIAMIGLLIKSNNLPR